MDQDEAVEVLKEYANNMMNENRRDKSLLLLEMLSDIILEDDLTKSFFKDIRGGI